MANNPANMLHASITGQMLKKFKTGTFEQGIKISSTLSNLVTSKSARDSTNDQHQIENRDGTMTYFASLGAPSQLRAVSAKYLFLDEISGATETDEGDPITLVSQRAATFNDSLIMMASTPIHPTDPIMIEYNKSDMRKFFVNCPHCNHEHTLEWENIKFEWDVIEGGRRKKANAESARLECPSCKATITDVERHRIVRDGRWIATRPEVIDTVGYNVSRIYSPLSSIKKIVQDFSDAHFNFDLRTFVNTSLGRPYEDAVNKEIDLTLLENQRDDSFNIRNIPDDCLGLFCGIDVQLDRIECTTIGITDNEKKIYVLDHRSFHAVDTTKRESPAYRELIQFLKYDFKTVNGKPVRRFTGFIDAGDGKSTNTVQAIAGQYRQHGDTVLRAIKGDGQVHAELFRRRKSSGKSLILLNVNEGKNMIAKLISQSVTEQHGDYASNIYFSASLPDDYFLQITSEKRIFKNGSYVWEKKSKSNNDRNECWDTLNYAFISVRWLLSRLNANPFKELRIYNSNNLKKIESTDSTDIDYSDVDVSNEDTPVQAQPDKYKVPNRKRRSFIQKSDKLYFN